MAKSRGTGRAGGKLIRAGLAHLRPVKKRLRGGRFRRPGNAGNDWRLGPRSIRHQRVADLTGKWKRYGGKSRDDFLHDNWDSAKGDWKYPPHEGFATRTTPSGATVADAHTRTLAPGERIDRFGQEGGRYLSPDGTPFEQRGLPPSNLQPRPGDPTPHNYHRYEVTRPFDVRSGPIAPAFDQPGGGVQHLVDGGRITGAPPDADVSWLVGNGFLKRLPLGPP